MIATPETMERQAEMQRDESRLRIYAVREKEILALYQPKNEHAPMAGFCLTSQTLPDGYRLMWVCHNYARKCFDFIVWHWSFEPVADGDEIPRMDGLASVDVHRFQRVNDWQSPTGNPVYELLIG